jgi:hypothetical protein
MNNPKHVIDQKNVKWTHKDKCLQQSCHLIFFKIKNINIRKVSMHFINKFLT